MHELIYGGINSRDYKAFITNAGLYKSPEKRYKRHTVPGRNGDLLEDTGTFENVEVEYPFCVYENCDRNLRGFITALRRKKGYQRIDDTFHPEYYRMGAFLDEFEPKRVTEDADKCNGVLKFDCLPQKFLTEGDEPIMFWTPNVSRRTDPGWTQNYEQMDTQRFSLVDKVGKSFKVTAHCPVEETIIVTYQSFETFSSGIPIDGDSVELENNETADIEFSTFASYGIFFVQTNGNISDVSVTFLCYIENAEGQNEAYEIEMCDKITLQNPTGYIALPLIEFLGLAVADLTIENYNDNKLNETYIFYTETETTIGTAYLDCEAMYMYDENDNNITNLLHLTTARDSQNKSLVFPRFGSEKIVITPRWREYNREEAPHWLPIIAIYPRWWTV